MRISFARRSPATSRRSAVSSPETSVLTPGRVVAAWIEDYNRDRRHSALGVTSPTAYERAPLDRAGAGPEQAA